jgi:hypothetical protein
MTEEWKVEVERRLNVLEMKSAVVDVHMVNIDKRLTGIESGVTRLLWVVITSVAAIIIGFAMRGGFNNLP